MARWLLPLLACSMVAAMACAGDNKDDKKTTQPPTGDTAAKAKPDTTGAAKAAPKPPPPPDTKKQAAKGTQPDALVGGWRASGQVGGNKPGEPGMSWLKEYKFAKDGSFVMTGYPPIHVQGKWAVVEVDGQRMKIALTDQEMRMSKRDKPSKWNDRQDWAELNGDSMTWQNNTYSRMKAK